MPLPVNILDSLVFRRLNKAPGPLLDMMGGMAFHVVRIAHDMGVFSALGKGPLDASGLARAIGGADERGVALLLDALGRLGYVRARRGRFRNSAMTRRWMLDSSPLPIADLFGSFADMMERWKHLPEAIATGKKAAEVGWHWFEGDPALWERYHRGQECAARLVAPTAAAAARTRRGDARLLDLGGGHGLFAVEFCRRNPGLSAVVFDFPEARASAERNIAAEGMEGRITFLSGDFLDDDFGGGYDMVLMASMLRIVPDGGVPGLLARVCDSLAPGGRAVIVDHLGHRASGGLLGLNEDLILLELFNALAGPPHDARTVIEWLRAAGLHILKEKKLRRTPGMGIIVAEAGQSPAR